MLKDITTINIQGCNFDTLSSLTFFEPRDGKDKQGNVVYKTVKGTLLYGRNGTGKSTIAKAFRKAKGEEQPTINHVSFLDKKGHPVSLSGEESKQIYVFDEDFVNEKVKLKEEHLDSIIMLGQAADLAEMIEQAEKDRDTAKTDCETMEIALKEFEDENNPKSPKKCLNKIVRALRGDDSWAGRDAKLRGARQNTSVHNDTYKQFLKLNPEQNKTDLLIEFDIQLKALEAAKTGASRINATVPKLPNNLSLYDEDALLALLSQKIEKPQLTEREQYLLGLVESGKANELSQKATVFKDPNIQQCPYCFQPVTDEYKNSLVSSIEKVLTKAVEDHQNSLGSFIIDVIEIDLSDFSCLSNHEDCIVLINNINRAIQDNNKMIQQKIDNPYQSVDTKSKHVCSMVKQLTECLEKLDLERTEYNEKVTDTESIINNLKEINSYIAHYDIVDLADEYDKQKQEYAKAKKAFKDAKDNYDLKMHAVEELEAQRKNIHIALDYINACLKYIFFADDRLRIEYVDGEYRLLSHGKSVRPCDVSVGERNIIGLSYFFASIMEGQEEKDAYGKEYLLVIDDPVSSFDTENRIGILSFLKYELGLFLEGNEFSKALIMTHDLMTFYDIHKLLEEIVNCCKRMGYSLKPKFNRFELSDRTISEFSYKKRQEYTEILKQIFQYGQSDLSIDDIVIGNLMRQALEAFATFQYKKGIEEVSTDPDILRLLPGDDYQIYYENLMYRLVLHGGSHKEEQIKAMKDYDFFSLISKEEKQRTAKEVITFMYLLNKPHILQHLQEFDNVEDTLEMWCAEIKERAVKT